MCDIYVFFAENYAFVVRNAAQSFYWNNDQATVFTVVIYYKEDNILKHRSLAMLSHCLTHDTIAVHEFQKIITHYLEANYQHRKMIYFTDGAAQHFKNKYYITSSIYSTMKWILVLQPSASTLPGTQKYHFFVLSAELNLMLRKCSSSLECDVFPEKTVSQRRKRSAHTL